MLAGEKMKTTFLFGALSVALAACRSREAPRT